jgi:MFS superfamily sulfate permease-like transporter
MEANAEVDITALDSLQRAVEHFHREGVTVALARVKHEVLLDLRRHGVLDVIGEDLVFPTMPTAVQAYEDWVQAED